MMKQSGKLSKDGVIMKVELEDSIEVYLKSLGSMQWKLSNSYRNRIIRIILNL